MNLEFWVAGIPAPKGSKKGYLRGKRVVLVDASDYLAAWEEAVTLAAEEALAGAQHDPAARAHLAALHERDVGVHVRHDFRIRRGVTVKRPLPTTPPDLDKLARAANDALTKAHLWPDDARIVSHHLTKLYADDERGPGLLVTVKGPIRDSHDLPL